MWLAEGREKTRFKKAKAPHDIEVFERALLFKRNPAEVRRYSDEVLQVAALMENDPAEVKAWGGRDRRWLLVTHAAHVAAAPKLAQKAK